MDEAARNRVENLCGGGKVFSRAKKLKKLCPIDQNLLNFHHKMEFNSSTVNSKTILCDIEGTTSSIDFVKETLFPYALKNVEKFLQDNWDRDDVKEAVVVLRKLSVEDAEEKVEGAVPVLGDDEDKAKVLESVVKSVEWLMGNDRKVTPLKTLQGLIWEAGYKDGTIKGHVYEDVPTAFDKWTKTGHKIYIYSSGSVMAQKLLFGNTTAGDLLSHLSGHFDTKIGAKQEKESYEAIAKEIECATEEILFLTDIVKEAKAAKEAGMNVVMLDRPGNAPLTDEEKKEFVVVTSFEAIPLEEVTTGKRKIPEEEEEEDKQETTKPAKLAKLDTVEEKTAEKVEEVDGETHAKKTDDESKSENVVEKIEIDRTDDETAKNTDQETESKVEKEEKMDTKEDTVEVTEDVKEQEKEKEVEEVTEKVEEEEVEKMEVDAVEEKKDPEADEVTEAEPKVLEEKEEEEVVAEAVVEEPPVAEIVTEEKKKEEEVVNGKSEVEAEVTEKAESVDKETPEAKTEDKKGEKEEKEEDEKPEETEKVTESTNGDAAAAAEEVNGAGGDKKDEEKVTEVEEEEKKTENGKDEVKNGHNENAAVAEAVDEEKTAQDSTASSASASDQVSSEVIVKKCVEPIKSPVAQPVEAAES